MMTFILFGCDDDKILILKEVHRMQWRNMYPFCTSLVMQIIFLVAQKMYFFVVRYAWVTRPESQTGKKHKEDWKLGPRGHLNF